MIGVFDSGVGGLSIWRELYNLMPKTGYLYFSDSANCPYGLKPSSFIVERADAITRFLISKGAGMVVVACNTATAATIDYLRSHYSIPFVGIEPAIKPAAITSNSGVVGVLATANTFKGSLYHNTLERFASNVEVIERVGNGLVELVEEGRMDEDEALILLHTYIDPMIEKGADTIVLGCTHYPFLQQQIQKIVPEGVKIINPAPAVALQSKRIANSLGLITQNSPDNFFYSTGDTSTLKYLVNNIIHISDSNYFETITV